MKEKWKIKGGEQQQQLNEKKKTKFFFVKNQLYTNSISCTFYGDIANINSATQLNPTTSCTYVDMENVIDIYLHVFYIYSGFILFFFFFVRILWVWKTNSLGEVNYEKLPYIYLVLHLWRFKDECKKKITWGSIWNKNDRIIIRVVVGEKKMFKH